MKLINVGFGNMVVQDRIVAIVSPDSAPIKRLIIDAKEAGRVIDVSCGRKTRAVILTDSEHVILSSLQTETIGNRVGGTDVDLPVTEKTADHKNNDKDRGGNI